MKEREKKEFDQPLNSVGGLRRKSEDIHKKGKSAETAFAVDRLKKLEDFISTMDKIVGMLLTLEDIKRNFLGIGKKKSS